MARLQAKTKRALRGMKCGKAVNRDKERTERDEVWQGCGQRERDRALRGIKCGKAVDRDKERTERDEVWQGCRQRHR